MPLNGKRYRGSIYDDGSRFSATVCYHGVRFRFRTKNRDKARLFIDMMRVAIGPGPVYPHENIVRARYLTILNKLGAEKLPSESPIYVSATDEITLIDFDRELRKAQARAESDRLRRLEAERRAQKKIAEAQEHEREQEHANTLSSASAQARENVNKSVRLGVSPRVAKLLEGIL